MRARDDVVSSLVLILLGAIWLFDGRQYSMGTPRLPGPGLVPVVAGVLAVALSAWLGITSLLTLRSAPTGVGAAGQPSARTFRGAIPLVMALAMGVYIYTLEWSGYLLNTFLLVLVGTLISGGRGWVLPLVVAVGTSVISYLLFVSLLNVPLPAGQLLQFPVGSR